MQANVHPNVMSHSSGLSGFDPAIENVEEIYDWDATVARLAAQEPWWKPGEFSGYHAITQGYLQGEIVRRATGKSLGTFFREEVAEPLGADFHIGLDPAHDGRVGEQVHMHYRLCRPLLLLRQPIHHQLRAKRYQTHQQRRVYSSQHHLPARCSSLLDV